MRTIVIGEFTIVEKALSIKKFGKQFMHVVFYINIPSNKARIDSSHEDKH